jgi:hypothetical protein
MAAIARPVYAYLESLYAAKSDGTAEERRVANQVSLADLEELMAVGQRLFKPAAKKRRPKTTTRVQYDAEIEDIKAIQEHVGRSLSASQIGRHTFDYFLEQEGLR